MDTRRADVSHRPGIRAPRRKRGVCRVCCPASALSLAALLERRPVGGPPCPVFAAEDASWGVDRGLCRCARRPSLLFSRRRAALPPAADLEEPSLQASRCAGPALPACTFRFELSGGRLPGGPARRPGGVAAGPGGLDRCP